jgi:16S rRNA (uracil1498-N3)-methyltransferase
MTRRRFIADQWTDTTATLTGQQADHLRRVLRAERGQVFDVLANGFLHRAEITAITDSGVTFELFEELEADAALPVHLLLAVIKFDHYEWGLEKATELGAARVTPVLARRTDKHLAQAAAKRSERWRRILLEAAKQSRRSDLPELDEPQALKAALGLASAPTKLLLAETEQDKTLRAALERDTAGNGPDAERNRALTLAIGPEGGWAPEEMSAFAAAGFKPVTLGPRILRAETAALAALSICSAFL